MTAQRADEAATSDAAWSAERMRLVRACARITGDAEAAEDLAQDTLIEAWRHAHTLRDPRGARGVARRHRSSCVSAMGPPAYARPRPLPPAGP